jgi:hypothetical protein
MKQNFLGFLLIIIFHGKHTLNVLCVNLLCYEVSQTICNNKYFENDIQFLLPLSNDLWFAVLGELPREYKDFQVAKEDYLNCDSLQK